MNNLSAARADAEAALDANPNAAAPWLLRARLALHGGESQQALAFHMYAQDYDETAVPTYYGFWSNPAILSHWNWAKLLARYHWIT